MTDPHLIYTCSKAQECAYARSHIGQGDNFVCQRCINHSLWLPLGAYLYCKKQGFSDGTVELVARSLVNIGKQFTADGDMIEDGAVTE